MGNEQTSGTVERDFVGHLLEQALIEQRRKEQMLTATKLHELLSGLETLAMEDTDDEETEVKAGNLPDDFVTESSCKWNPNDCSNDIRLSRNCVTATKKKTKTKSTDLVRTCEGFKEGIHAFKIFCPKSKRGNLPCVVGLAASSTPRQESGYKTLIGGQSTSVGWDIVAKRGLFDNKIICTYPENHSPTFQVPDFFIMIVDLNRGVLLFKTEDEDYGVCLSGLDTQFADKGILLYPAVSMTSDDCEISIAKHPLVINPSRERAGLEKLIPAWIITNIIMAKKEINECDDAAKLLLQLNEVFRRNKDSSGVNEVLINIIISFDECKTLVEYLNFCWENITESRDVEQCFLILSLFLSNFTSDNSAFPIAWNKSGGFKVIDKILREVFNKPGLGEKQRTSTIGYLLGVIYNSTRVPEVKQAIKNGEIMDRLQECYNLKTDIPLIPVSAAMAIGNVLSDDKKKSFVIREGVLVQISRMIRDGANGKKIDCNGINFEIEELLETVQNVMDCPDNCSYFIIRGLMVELNKFLKNNNDNSGIIDLALCCLNKAFTRLLFLLRDPKGPKKEKLIESVKVEGLAEVLTKLKNMKSKSFHDAAETCSIKMSEILRGKSEQKCHLQGLCNQFLKEELKIDENLFDRQQTMCFCQFCHVQRNDNEYYDRGKPPRKYALPIGWFRIGVKPPPAVKAVNAFSTWYRAFYKLIDPIHAKTILKQGGLVMNGSKDCQGKIVGEGTSTKRLLLSPTVRYCDYYTKTHSWKGNYEVKAALQVLVRPESFKSQKGTVHGCKVLDPIFPNDEIEWSIDRQGSAHVYGLLIKVTEKQDK